MNLEITMLKYINETSKMMKDIIDNRKTNYNLSLDYLKNKKIDHIELIGSGTSCNAELSVIGFMEKVLNLRVNYSYAFPFKFNRKCLDSNTLVIAISQSGESKSTIEAIKYAKSKGAHCFSFTERCEDSLSKIVDVSLALNCGIEDIGAKTKGYQASTLSLILFGLEYALLIGSLDGKRYDNYIERIKKVVNNLDNIINKSINWYELFSDEFKRANRIIILGYDSNYGNVLEGKLKLEETVRYGIEAYEQEEFMHGIYNAIDEKTYIIYLAQESEHKIKVNRLIELLKPYTDKQYVIGNGFDFDFGFIDDEYFSIFEYIIPIQCLAYYLSRDLNINITKPKIANFHKNIGSK